MEEWVAAMAVVEQDPVRALAVVQPAVRMRARVLVRHQVPVEALVRVQAMWVKIAIAEVDSVPSSGSFGLPMSFHW